MAASTLLVVFIMNPYSLAAILKFVFYLVSPPDLKGDSVLTLHDVFPADEQNCARQYKKGLNEDRDKLHDIDQRLRPCLQQFFASATSLFPHPMPSTGSAFTAGSLMSWDPPVRTDFDIFWPNLEAGCDILNLRSAHSPFRFEVVSAVNGHGGTVVKDDCHEGGRGSEHPESMDDGSGWREQAV
ncbi:hypothetical protein R3P38DRAFT_2814363 [Favolaschia claudopus]|uniref:Uncharacterized protein n=1 Tax=Favolaschia claudopus TaxID=2862362 RepID=A0AAV9Z3P9_9AGAR